MKYTDSKYQNEVLQIVGDYCGKPVTNFTEDPFQTPLTWSFYHAFFFSFTVCSTVGTLSFLFFVNSVISISFQLILLHDFFFEKVMEIFHHQALWDECS